MMLRGTLGLFLIGVAAAAGCGGNGLPPGAKPTAPVTVTITYKNAPVEGATVTFVGTGEDPTPAYGLTDAQGIAKMKTYVEGDGAVLGTHNVSVNKSALQGGAKAAEQESIDYTPPEVAVGPTAVIKNAIPEKYSVPATSGLTANVQTGPNEFKFELND